jgi:hypothetical protein
MMKSHLLRKNQAMKRKLTKKKKTKNRKRKMNKIAKVPNFLISTGQSS